MPRHDTIKIEDARIIYRNFAGREGEFNNEGDRNFGVILNEIDAENLLRAGWNVKRTNPRPDEEEGVPYIKVSVSYKVMTPMIWMITSRGRTHLKEDLVGILDNVEIATADMFVNPSKWEIGKKTGIKAYLETLYITIIEDDLMKKYADVPEAGAEN